MSTPTQQQIIDGNKMIAEYTGWRFEKVEKYWHGYFEGIKRWVITDREFDDLFKPDIKGFPFHSDWNKLMPVVEKIRTFRDPYKAEDSYVFGTMSVDISSAYPRGWTCHIIGTLTRFTKLPTGMHDYNKLPPYSKSIHSEHNEYFIEPVWQSVADFITWYNQNKQK